MHVSRACTGHPCRNLAEGREAHKCAPAASQELVDGFWLFVAVRPGLCLMMLHGRERSHLYF